MNPSASSDEVGSDSGAVPAGQLTLYECLTSRGWHVELLPDGSIEASSETIPEEQYEQYAADRDECAALAYTPLSDLTDGDWQRLYQLELEARDCLISLGYEIEEPPSYQQFREEGATAPWSAHAALLQSAALTPDEWGAAVEQCPQALNEILSR